MSAAAETFRIRSPGDGAYRVRLFERSGESAAEAFLAGHGRTGTVELPPGDYWAMVVDVGTGRSTGRVPVTLSGADQPLVLPDPLTGKAAAPPVEIPAPRASASFAIEGRSSRFAVKGAAGTFRRSRRFDIAISEDRAPGSIGGWRAPEGLDVAVKAEPGSSALRVTIRDGRTERKSRVRMSIGLEGLPTIRVPLPLYREGLEVSIRPSPDENGSPDVLVEVAAVDRRLQSLVTALAGLSSIEAMSVLNWASDGSEEMAVAFLAEKARDLWAATVAALLLVKLGRTANVTQWLRNLARLAPHIADAPIAAAWGCIADPQIAVEAAEKEAMDYLERSGRIGAPNYTVANSLDLELLSSLHGTAAERKVRDVAGREYGKATLRSRFRLFKSPYMIWEEAGEKLHGGRLPGDHYHPVAHGILTADTLQKA